MPSLLQRFARARNANGGDDPPARPRTAAEEQLSRPATSAAAPVGGETSNVAQDSVTPVDVPAETAAPAATDPEQIAVGEGQPDAAEEEQPAVDAAAVAAAAAELKKARQKAKAAEALKKMKARSSFSLWRWLPAFYDPVEDTIRSRIIAVLAVAIIPAMLTGLLLEPMITDVASVTGDKVILFSSLYVPMDPMYVGVLPAKGYEFRFVVRNSKYWPQPGALAYISPPPSPRAHSPAPPHPTPPPQASS